MSSKNLLNSEKVLSDWFVSIANYGLKQNSRFYMDTFIGILIPTLAWYSYVPNCSFSKILLLLDIY